MILIETFLFMTAVFNEKRHKDYLSAADWCLKIAKVFLKIAKSLF